LLAATGLGVYKHGGETRGRYRDKQTLIGYKDMVSLLKNLFRVRKQKSAAINSWVAIGGILLLLMLGWLVTSCSLQPAASITFPHIHGLAFSADGSQIIVPAHDGFRVYENGAWRIPAEVPARDYMGYSAVDAGFYSSGHPQPGTMEINPMGLVRSEDLGDSLIELGFEGETDFHLMAAGFYNHAIYVINPSPNSELQAGLYYSLDDGQTWTPASASGLTAQPYALAVHPTDPNMVAMATGGGLFLSVDYGDSFSLIGPPNPAVAVSFSPFGDSLLFGAEGIYQYGLVENEMTNLGIPALDSGDVILYITISRANSDHMAMATANLDIFYTTDGGDSWQALANNGQAQ